jgi:thiamine transporter
MFGSNVKESEMRLMVRKLVLSAMCIALAFVLSWIVVFRMPQGGSVTLASMLFVALVGYWCGFRAGLTAGIAYGLLRMAFGGFIVTPVQAALDYVVAYGALGGLAGVLKGKRFGSYGLYIGYTAGVCGLFAANFMAGVVFFGEFAPEGQHVAVYSAVYNLSHTLPEVIITFAILSLPHFKQALNIVTPKGSVSEDNALSRFIEMNKTVKIHYAITAAALIASFFFLPLVHRAERIRTNASGWEISAGTGNFYEFFGISAEPIALALLIAPVVLLVMVAMKVSRKAMLAAAAAGALIFAGFIVGAVVRMNDPVFDGGAALTRLNWVICAVYAGLVVGLWFDKPKETA